MDAARRRIDPGAVDRALAGWREHDTSHAIHPMDREAIRGAEAARALVVELLPLGERPVRDLYNACARLGRLLADAGASPTLAATTLDGAALALTGPIDPDRLSAARASIAEGYVAGVREAERAAARRTWDYPGCTVVLDQETVAIAAGHPADSDADLVSAWAAKVALAVSKSGKRRAVVTGQDPARSELVDALGLLGVTTLDALPARRFRLPWQR